MRVAVGKDYHDFRLLSESDKTLKSEGFYKSAKVLFMLCVIMRDIMSATYLCI